jgi:phosphopantetheinyl transferase (holo-ACP synthase)
VKSTGNDIVALKAIDIRRTTSTAFYSKFIIPAEQALYQQPQLSAIPFENFIWLLWSVKESVYKYLQRSEPGLIFSPAKIIVKDIRIPHLQTEDSFINQVWESDQTREDFYNGRVIYGSYQLYFRSKINAEFIASVVNNTSEFENVYWGVSSIEQTDAENQSIQTRKLLLNKLKHVDAGDDLQIQKNTSGCPVLLKNSTPLNIPVSLAHHFQFISYSFVIA